MDSHAPFLFARNDNITVILRRMRHTSNARIGRLETSQTRKQKTVDSHAPFLLARNDSRVVILRVSSVILRRMRRASDVRIARFFCHFLMTSAGAASNELLEDADSFGLRRAKGGKNGAKRSAPDVRGVRVNRSGYAAQEEPTSKRGTDEKVGKSSVAPKKDAAE